MDFRRSGQLDERRRRVLMDEIAAPADSDASTQAASAAKGPVRAYHGDVLTERQPRVTDLVPVRPLWVVVALLLGLTGIATIEAIHVHATTLPLAEGGHLLAALDARQQGSLATGFSAALLAGAAVLALVTYGIRVHRVDDYRGRYRVWLWTSAALVWLALDAATGLRQSLGLGLTLLAGKQVFTGPIAAGATMTWIAVYSLAFGTLGLRLAVEMWPSRLSFATLLTASVLYVLCSLFQLDIVREPSWLIAGTLESSLALFAHLTLAASVMLYTRHTYLDATGRLKVHIDRDKKPKAKPRAKLKVVKADESKVTAAPPDAARPRSAPSPAAQPAKSPAAPAPAAKSSVAISKSNLTSPDENEDDDEDEYGDNLSKSERRRLKKLARREQQRRAA